MARGIWTAGSGGGADLDELGSAGATPAHVLSGRTFYGAGSEKVQIGTIPVVQGATIVPGTVNKTAIAAGRYANASIFVSGDPNLVPANIKKNSVIFGVRGTFEGWVPTATDLYYNGANPAGLTTPDTFVYFQNERIFGQGRAYINLNCPKSFNVSTYSKLNISGEFVVGTKKRVTAYLRNTPGGNVIVESNVSGIEESAIYGISLDITQLTSINANFQLSLVYLNSRFDHWINHIWFS